MESFLHRHRESVTGVLSGFDRLRLRGTFRMLANSEGMGIWLYRMGCKIKQFGSCLPCFNRLAS